MLFKCVNYNVQRIRRNIKRYPDSWGEAAPLTGLIYGADCGGKMYVHRTYSGPQYTCAQYSKVPVGTLSPTHCIVESVVLSLSNCVARCIMGSFKIPKIPPTTNKSIRFPNDLIEEAETAMRGKECTFSAFVVEAVRVALANLEEGEEGQA